MVTPTTGVMKWVGRGGRAYNVAFYIADVVGTDIKFSQDGAAGTGSPSFWIAPEDVVLQDLSLTTGPTVMTGLKFKTNDTPTGQQILIANHLNTLANRISPAFGARGGRKITFTEF